MAQPTIDNYFGLGAQVIDSETTLAATPSNPYLVIPFTGLSDSGLTDPDSLSDPDKVFTALLKLVRLFTSADTAEESGIEVGAPRKSFQTRGGGSKLAYDFDVTIYLPDPTTELDPDLVI